MNKLFTGLFIFLFLALGAWIKFSNPNADKYDPFRNPLASFEIIKGASNLFSSNTIESGKEKSSSNTEINQNIYLDKGIQIPINDEFKQELLGFYKDSQFSKKYSSFIDRLTKEQEVVLYPAVRSYINKVSASNIDNKYFSLTVFLNLEDNSGNPVIISSKFIADKKLGSPKKNIVLIPGQDKESEFEMPDKWNGFTLYDIGLFSLISYANP